MRRLADFITTTALRFVQRSPRLAPADKFWADGDKFDDIETAARKARLNDRYDFDILPAHVGEIRSKDGSFVLNAAGLSIRPDLQPEKTRMSPRLYICFRPVDIDGKQELVLVGFTDDAGDELDSLQLAGYGAEWSADGEYEQLSIEFDG